MTDKRDYYERAESWAADTRAKDARARGVAWTVAGVAVAAAAFEAVALAMLVPLKTVQPITLLVDKQTGYVQALDPLTPRRVAADDALTNAFLAQYVLAREGFDRATIATDYRRVALWSGGGARRTYLAQMPANNSASPFQRYPAGTIIQARVKSVSRLNPGVALVRFDTQLGDRTGRVDTSQPWIAVVRYRYMDAPMRLEDRLVNPLGFQVLGYRRDAEAPPPPASVQAAVATLPAAAPSSVVTTTTLIRPPGPAAQSGVTMGTRPPNRSDPAALRPQTIPTSRTLPRTGAVERREVPLANLPLGSPLSPAGLTTAMVATEPLQ